MPDIGRTMTVNSLIAPSSSSWMKSHPSICLSPTRVSNTSAWSRAHADVGTDFADIAEVFEHGHHGCQQPAHRFATVIWLEHGGAAKDDVLAHQCNGSVEITRFDRATEGVHHLTTSLVNKLNRCQ